MINYVIDNDEKGLTIINNGIEATRPYIGSFIAIFPSKSPNNKPCRKDRRGCFDKVTKPLKSLFE